MLRADDISVLQADRLTIDQMGEFLQGIRQIKFKVEGKSALYGFVQKRGTIRSYLMKLTGLSLAQTTRLIARWNERREVQPLPPRRPKFPRLYTSVDIALLAAVDAAHDDLCQCIHDAGIAHTEVVVVPRTKLDSAVGLQRYRGVPVKFDFVDPAPALRQLVSQEKKHRLNEMGFDLGLRHTSFWA